MKKFLHYEDNEDGTVSVKCSMDGVNVETILIEMPFGELFAAYVTAGGNPEFDGALADKMVMIPDTI